MNVFEIIANYHVGFLSGLIVTLKLCLIIWSAGLVIGTGLGAALMRAAIDRFRAVPGVKKVKLGAQTHALGFYERLGFTAIGDDFDEAGIAHREMVLPL